MTPETLYHAEPGRILSFTDNLYETARPERDPA